MNKFFYQAQTVWFHYDHELQIRVESVEKVQDFDRTIQRNFRHIPGAISDLMEQYFKSVQKGFEAGITTLP